MQFWDISKRDEKKLDFMQRKISIVRNSVTLFNTFVIMLLDLVYKDMKQDRVRN